MRVDLKWLAFLIELLYLVAMWFGEDQRANIIKRTCLKEIELMPLYTNEYYYHL